MAWTNPNLSLGFVVALIVLILDCILKALGMIDLNTAMTVAAICAWRL